MRILLVDDHPLFLDGLKTLLTVRGFDVVGTARDGLEAIEKAHRLKPQVILMDLEMPHLGGLAATRSIKTEQPEVKIVMLTMSASHEDLYTAIRAGACGYVLKTEDTDSFFQLLSDLLRGEAPLSASMAARVLEEFARQERDLPSGTSDASQEEPLTPRQVEVLSLVAQGLIYKEVAAKLFVTEQTVKYHMGQIIQRLHLKNRREAIEYARSRKLDRK
ncbi:MAG: response regulator transcription factor [Sedimentisphaerales bacterium]|nr:response regulator transcription factor [Sedimentisphaerales bacterium]